MVPSSITAVVGPPPVVRWVWIRTLVAELPDVVVPRVFVVLDCTHDRRKGAGAFGLFGRVEPRLKNRPAINEFVGHVRAPATAVMRVGVEAADEVKPLECVCPAPPMAVSETRTVIENDPLEVLVAPTRLASPNTV